MIIKHISVIGATGATGKEVIQYALQQGYRVTAIARKPDAILPQQNLTIVSGDVLNEGNLLNAFANVDAVVSCFGPANNFKPGNLMSVGTKNIVNACAKAGVKRLVFMSGILQSDGKELTLFNRLGQKTIRLFYRKVYEDKKLAENEVINSGLNWTIVRAVGLNNSPGTGQFKWGVNLSVLPFTPLAQADCAACLVQTVPNESLFKTIINVGK
jgi:putative NADH-flavin reductase